MNIFWIIVILTAMYLTAWMLLRWMTKPIRFDDEPSRPVITIPNSCGLVNEADIEPPHAITLTCAELKAQYLEAEAEMVATHDPAMAPKIRRQMAEALIQGWPLDVTICQSAYSFFYGTCRCATCRSLLESHA